MTQLGAQIVNEPGNAMSDSGDYTAERVYPCEYCKEMFSLAELSGHECPLRVATEPGKP